MISDKGAKQMSQRKLSMVLMLAGGLAVIGVAFLLYIMPAFLLVYGGSPLYSLTQMALGVPYMAALWHYFRICKNIGDDRSFCPENARRMDIIAKLLFLASGLWALMLIAMLLVRGGAITGYELVSFVEVLLTLMATLAVGLVAKMMALLVGRASRLQEENDLTI